jgi:hypothetical protein
MRKTVENDLVRETDEFIVTSICCKSAAEVAGEAAEMAKARGSRAKRAPTHAGSGAAGKDGAYGAS